MKHSIFSFIVVVSILLLNACGGTKELTKTDSGDIPDWYLNTPTEPDYIFAASSATSRDMDLAITKASTEARAGIARNIEIKINSMQKKFEEEVGQGESSEFLSQFTQATKTVVSKELSGSQITQKKLEKDGSIWRAYVLAKYPIGAAQKAFLRQISDNNNLYTRVRSTEAFKELENEVSKYENPNQIDNTPKEEIKNEGVNQIKEEAQEVVKKETPMAEVETKNQIITIDNFTFELIGCKIENRKITASLVIKNTSENDLELVIGIPNSKIFDEAGNEYTTSIVKLANSSSKSGWSRLEKQTVPGIPTPAEFVFENISSKTTQISLLSIDVASAKEIVKFRDIDLINVN
ncbi:MAG: LPP20 family lipoprotein [Bacteroidetes bacterium]|nr:LPP20 family lipoprotein [Bacteroidota bacterium]